MAGDVWTKDEVSELERYCAAGKSFEQMSVLLGKSRSAVGGKVNRLGLQFSKATAVRRKVIRHDKPVKGDDKTFLALLWKHHGYMIKTAKVERLLNV